MWNTFKKIVLLPFNYYKNKTTGEITSRINDLFYIKNMSNENNVYDKMENLYDNALNDNFVYENISNLEMLIKEIVYSIGIILIEFLGFSFIYNNTLSLGTFLTFTLLTSYFLDPIKNIIDLNKEYYYAINSMKRVNNLLDVEEDNLSTKTNYSIQGNIKLNNLTFSYNEEVNILESINFEVNIGEKVMILGNSGSGKSTILKLLLKYYKTKRGTIYINNIDICDLTINDVRSNISAITQNEILFNDTIKNNIIMNRNITDDEFMEVCSLTFVDEFVKNLFLGYDTMLEENGLNLSGGQRQRIILARALLKKAKIILIDEGLNALDINLERKILKNIFQKYKDISIIIISHRLENIDLFDKVIKLEQGKIYDELIYQKDDKYEY